MALQSVGLREFRTHLHKYTQQSQEPIIITAHGETIGYYIPAQSTPQEQKFEALIAAAHKLATVLTLNSIDEDELVAEFQQVRQHDLSS